MIAFDTEIHALATAFPTLERRSAQAFTVSLTSIINDLREEASYVPARPSSARGKDGENC